MQDDLGVGGRLHHGAFAHELSAQRQSVGQVAVVADGEAAGIELGEQRLHVAQRWFRRWSNSAHGRSRRCRAGGRSPRAAKRRRRRGRGGARNGNACRRTRRCRPPPGRGAASACRPSAVMAAASGWPKMPKTPHSSRSRSASSIEEGRSVMVFGISARHSSSFEQMLHAGAARAIRADIGASGGRRVDFAMLVGRGLGGFGVLRPLPSSASLRWWLRGSPATAP